METSLHGKIGCVWTEPNLWKALFFFFFFFSLSLFLFLSLFLSLSLLFLSLLFLLLATNERKWIILTLGLHVSTLLIIIIVVCSRAAQRGLTTEADEKIQWWTWKCGKKYWYYYYVDGVRNVFTSLQLPLNLELRNWFLNGKMHKIGQMFKIAFQKSTLMYFKS